MEIRISNPNNLPLIDYHKPIAWQGELKDLSDKNYQKLKQVLLKRGFKVPLFIWQHEGKEYLMDGTQRQRVMIKEDMQPYEVPYILVEANTVAEAKAQLLEISSQYGTIQQDELDKFTAELESSEFEDTVFDALPDFSREDGNNSGSQNESKELVCPECGHTNSPSAFKPISD